MKKELLQSAEIAQTKINIPYIKGINIKRHKLLDKLSKALDYSVTLIAAAAGFGKSNLLASWLNEGFKERVFASWVSLDKYDNHPEVFWNYVLLSLGVNIQEVNKVMASISSGYLPEEGVNIPLISMVINKMMKTEEEVVLVLDDFHFIDHPSILQGIKFFVKNMPCNMHLVLSGRFVPDIGLARLRAADNLLEITQSELCFSMEECSAFLSKNIETKLSLEDIVQIERETEGWAIALQMTSLYLRNNRGNRMKERFNNSSMVFDYLSEEVFLSLTPETRQFLMFTSVLDEFSASLCDELLETNNSKQMIEDIDKKNLFVTGLDSHGEYYRCHNLFRDFLRARFEREYKSFVPVLLDKAGDWYAGNNQWIKAINYYIDGEGYEKAVSLIESVSVSFLWKGQASQLVKLNDRLPKCLVDSHPRLLLNNAWGSLAKGEMSSISGYIDSAEEILRRQSKEEGIKKDQLGEMAVLRSGSLMGTKDLDNIILSCEQALQYFETTNGMIQLIVYGMANAYLLKGELKKAREYYEKILCASMEANSFYTMILANRALTTLRKGFGEYRLAESECFKVISKFDTGVSYPLLGLTYAALADLLLQKNDLSNAIEMAKKGLELGEIGEDVWVMSENNIIMAKIHDALGLEKEALEELTKAERGINYSGFLETMLNLESMRAHILIRNGRIKEADCQIEQTAAIIEPIPVYVYPNFTFSKVRLLIAKKQYHRAKELLSLMKSYTDELKGILTEVLLLEAITCYELGDMGCAKENILKTLEINKECTMAGLFLFEGKAIEELLKLVRNEIAAEGDETLKQSIDYILKCFESKYKNCDQKGREILSSREIEILVLIEKGFSNSEISQKLYVSINTIKTHLLNIYTKLDVHSRTGAVSKAREMGML